MYGHQVTAENYGSTKDGMRFFGVLSLRSAYTGYEDVLGLRNSHDRSFPVSIGCGSRVFVCDNMAFLAEHQIKRRHTLNLKRDLPGIVSELIEPLALEREAQANKFLTYRHTMLSDAQADHAIMSLYRDGVLNVQRIPDVLEQWEKPTFPDLEERNVWRLFNSVTHALKGRVMDNPAATPRLHQVLDGFCDASVH